MPSKLKKTIWLTSLLLLLFLPAIGQAQEECKDDTVSQFIPCECLEGNAENCGLLEFAQLFANLYSFGLRYLGALALLLFVIGGIMFMTAGGNQERVTRGRHILIGTTIGIFIVLGSYLIVAKFQDFLQVKSQYKLDPSTANQCELNNGTCISNCDATNCTGTCQPNIPPYACPGDVTNKCCLPN